MKVNVRIIDGQSIWCVSFLCPFLLWAFPITILWIIICDSQVIITLVRFGLALFKFSEILWIIICNSQVIMILVRFGLRIFKSYFHMLTYFVHCVFLLDYFCMSFLETYFHNSILNLFPIKHNEDILLIKYERRRSLESCIAWIFEWMLLRHTSWVSRPFTLSFLKHLI